MPAGSTLIDRAARIVQDTTKVRWPEAEMVDWLNDGQREIILHRPDSNPKSDLLTMVAGTRQTLSVANGLSSTPAKLLDVVCNATGASLAAAVRTSAVRLIQREVLDAQAVAWHYTSPATEIKHYMFDPRHPLSFLTYPAVSGGASKVQVLYSAYPTDFTVGTLANAVSISDIYLNALLDYMLYRAYSKDSEYAGNAQRAQFHYQSFASSLALELKGTIKMGPTASGSVWNPNTPKLNSGQSATQPKE